MKNVLKKKWGKPVTEVQQFTPQEFVALCATCEVGHGINTMANISGLPGYSNFTHQAPCNPPATSTNVETTGTMYIAGNKTVYVWFQSSPGVNYYHAATTADNHS